VAALVACLVSTDTCRSETLAGLDQEASAALEAWLRTPDPVLVVLVLDGLEPEALDLRGPDDRPLMPHLRNATQGAFVFEDCLTGSPQPELGLYHLVTGRRALHAFREMEPAWTTGMAALIEHGLRPAGLCFREDLQDEELLAATLPWLTMIRAPSTPSGHESPRAAEQVEAMRRMLDETLATPEPALLLWVSDLLVPPFELPTRWLAAYDPAPWTGARGIAVSEDLQRNRLVRAERFARMDADVLRRSQESKRTAEPDWLTATAHAYADSLLSELLAATSPPESARRIGLVVTATHGMSYRVPSSGGGPLDADTCRVPLFWRFPGYDSQTERVNAPAMLGDLATTLAGAAVARTTASEDIPETPGPDRSTLAVPAGSTDWREPIPRDRERWSFVTIPRRVRPGGSTLGVRLSTSMLTYREAVAGRPRLFDLQADRGEYEDLASGQTALVETLDQRVRTSLWGAQPEVWLIVKPPQGAGQVEGSLWLTVPVTSVESLQTEPDDTVTGEQEISFRLGGDSAGDAVRIRLESPDPDLRLLVELTLRGADQRVLRREDAARWPIYAGGRPNPEAWATILRLSRLELTGVEKLVPVLTEPPPPFEDEGWRERQEPGVHLWIVAPDSELLKP
jgi:hypothetical protein